MRIGIDARSIHLEGAGRYIRELIANLSRIDDKNEYIIYFLSEEQMHRNRIEKQNFFSAILPISLYDLHKQPLLTYRLMKDKIDLFHATDLWLFPIFPPCNMVITIHDLMIYYIPESSTRQALLYGRVFFPHAFKKSKKLILTSQFMKEQLLKLYPDVGYKISAVPLGVSECFKVKNNDNIENVITKYNIKKKFVLYVGNLRSHKNIGRLLEAFSKLPEEIKNDYNLVIVADKMKRYSEILKRPRKLGIEEHVQFVGFVQNDDLSAIYKLATVLVLPSLCEWFGLPIVEAMASGTPVITSNITSMPEIAGDAGLLINPYDSDELKTAIEKVIMDKQLRSKLVIMGKERAKLYSWPDMATKVLDIYKELNEKTGG